MSKLTKKYLGDKAFYKMVLGVALPIIVQNAISNFVNLLDNIMVGQVGTEQMSGVAIVNQLMFVFNLALFGAVSGPGIFTAQYVGQKNHEGVRHTVRIKLGMVLILTFIGVLVLWNAKDLLIGLFLTDNGENLDITATLDYAKDYLGVMLVGLLPFAITNAYADTLRESGETKVPMFAGLTAVMVNLLFNWILIFGHLGAPKLGVVGAAVATVMSRFVELAIIVTWTHTHPARVPFAQGLYKSFKIPGNLLGKVLAKGTPLFANEFLWSLGMSSLTQCYSTRGLEVIAAFNISNTITNLFNVVMISMGNVVAIIIGQILGSGDTEEVVDTDRKLITFSVLASTALGIVLIVAAPLFPKFYNTTDDIRALAVELMRLGALFMPFVAYLNSAYFTIRSGGKTFITFLFDSAFLWCVSFPVAFFISRYTDMKILPMYFIVMSLDLIKVVIGAILIKKRIWIQNLVEN